MEIKNKLTHKETADITYEACKLVWEHRGCYYRYGQAVFNLLAEHHKDLAEEIRGTELDFFYKDDNFTNDVLVKCIKEIK